MRKVRFILFIGLAILGLVSCSKESEIIETPENNQEEYVLSFTGKRPVLGSETRTEWNGSSIVWSSKDKIRIGYTIGGNWQSSGREGDATPKFYQSDDVAIDSNNPDVGTFTVPISSSAFTDQGNEGEYVFYGIYPSTAINNAAASNAPSVYVTIPISQTPGENTFDKGADLLIGQTEPTDLSALPTDAIGITWSRIVAHGFLTFKDFKNVADGETINKISLTANTPLAGGFTIDVSSGEYSTQTGSNELTINGTNLSFTQEDSKTNVVAWVCLLPETITSLDVDVETNKAHYTRNITGISRTFKQNAKNNLTINMGSATRTPKTGPLVADGYYVISYGDNMMTVGNVSNNYRGSATKNVTNPSDDAIWKIQYVSDNDAYTIYSLGAKNNLYGTTSDNTYLKLSSGSNLTNLFTIEKSSSDASTYKISPYNSTRSIGYNISSPRFAAYAGSAQQPITLDLTSVTVDESPIITIASEERTKSVSASATSVSFTYTANAFATEVPTVSVTSDESSIINGTPAVSDGTITVELNPNTTTNEKTATLSVSGNGIDTPITLTINQGAKGGDVTENVATIYFGNQGTNINGASVTCNDSKNNEWTITTNGTDSFTQSTSYSQVGSSKKPATSITFTTTLPESASNISLEAKFGGFSGTAGDVSLKVGDATIGTGSLNETNDVTVTSTSTGSGKVLTVTVTNIAKGVKCYYIKATYTN